MFTTYPESELTYTGSLLTSEVYLQKGSLHHCQVYKIYGPRLGYNSITPNVFSNFFCPFAQPSNCISYFKCK